MPAATGLGKYRKRNFEDNIRLLTEFHAYHQYEETFQEMQLELDRMPTPQVPTPYPPSGRRR